MPCRVTALNGGRSDGGVVVSMCRRLSRRSCRRDRPPLRWRLAAVPSSCCGSSKKRGAPKAQCHVHGNGPGWVIIGISCGVVKNKGKPSGFMIRAAGLFVGGGRFQHHVVYSHLRRAELCQVFHSGFLDRRVPVRLIAEGLRHP